MPVHEVTDHQFSESSHCKDGGGPEAQLTQRRCDIAETEIEVLRQNVGRGLKNDDSERNGEENDRNTRIITSRSIDMLDAFAAEPSDGYIVSSSPARR